jgi:Tol biopolymer transport system component
MQFVWPRRVALGLMVGGAVAGAAQFAPRPPSAAAQESGGLIVFSQGTGAGLGSDPYGAIWIARPDGSMAKELLGGDQCNDCYSSPRLSPDATKIAYANFVESGANAVFVMGSDGTGSKAVCVGKCNYPIAWSPNGRQLAVGTETPSKVYGSAFQVGIFDLKSRRLRVLSKIRGQVDSFDWARDGTRLAVATIDGTLWLIRPDGSGARIIARGVADPRWSPDGKNLLLNRHDDRRIGTMPSSGGRLTLIPRLGAGDATWSPDGQQILFSDFSDDGLAILDRASGHVHQLNLRSRNICNRPAIDKYGSGATGCGDLDWRP